MVKFNQKKITPNGVFFYKSSIKESGSQSWLIESTQEISFDVQNILFQRSWIVINILSGEKYLSTSSHNKSPNLGKIKIEITIKTRPNNAYLIELIAGLIFSSLPQDKINKSPPRKIKAIEKILANKTIKEIANRIKSQNSIASVNTCWDCVWVENHETA